MEASARAPKPELRIDVEALDETAPLLGPHASRRPNLQSLDTQVHPPAIDEIAPLLAMPAVKMLAADYEDPVSAVSYDAPMRKSDAGPSKDGDGMPKVQILLLCYCCLLYTSPSPRD